MIDRWSKMEIQGFVPIATLLNDHTKSLLFRFWLSALVPAINDRILSAHLSQ